MVTATIFTEL